MALSAKGDYEVIPKETIRAVEGIKIIIFVYVCIFLRFINLYSFIRLCIGKFYWKHNQRWNA